MIDIIRKKRDGGELDAREIGLWRRARRWVDSGGRAGGVADGVVDSEGSRSMRRAR
jgi:hypothetical protein